MRIFHVSEDPGIKRFEPRMGHAYPEKGPLVFAIADSHLRNYLVPRECPRVTFYANKVSRDSDVEKLLNGDRDAKVLAIEAEWYRRVQSTPLCLYEFEISQFDCIDEGAGTFVSREAVTPLSMSIVNNPLQELEQRRVDVRVLDTLWFLHDTVAASSLKFSMIRMRNAAPRRQLPS